MKTVIPVENGDTLTALRGFLQRLLESGALEALYVPLETPAGAVVPALVTEPAHLEHANPLAPVMPINSARAVAALTGREAPARIGAVLRPCEIRALIELVKLQQATLEGLTLIGMDCTGTFEVPGYQGARANGGGAAAALAGLQAGQAPALGDLLLREACAMCTHPTPENAAVQIEWLGADPAQGIPLALPDELGTALGMAPAAGDGAARQTAVEVLLNARRGARQQALQAIQARLDAPGGLDELFGACVRCHNCMTVCPICYCKVCLFRSASFDHKPDHYLTAARRKGAVRLLGDTLLFHVTRMNHMSASCVSCGMCTSACPSDIPVGAIFSAVGERVQAAFSYEPGRDPQEPLPLVTFRENEWTEVGEAR